MTNAQTTRSRLPLVVRLWVLCALCGGGVVVSLCLAADKPGAAPAAAGSAPGAGPVASAPASRPIDPNQVANDPDVKLLVKGLNEFAIDLYKEIAKTEKGNIFFSPFSISSALAMVYTGARGQTAEQMRKVLHFPPDLAKGDGKALHRAYARLVRHLNAEKNADGHARKYQLVVANALWGQKGTPFLKEFLELNTGCYGAGMEQVDFATAPEEALNIVNAWVEKQTREKIKAGGVVCEAQRSNHGCSDSVVADVRLRRT